MKERGVKEGDQKGDCKQEEEGKEGKGKGEKEQEMV